jgi:soluble lytic murein transglycosylase-like protein
MNLRTLTHARTRAFRSSLVGAHRPPRTGRRPALYLAVAAGALMVNVVTTGEPAAHADGAQLESVSIAHQLGIASDSAPQRVDGDTVRPLEQLAASRSQRDADQAAAAQSQAAADQAALDARAAAEAAAREAAAAAEAAAREAEAQAAAATRTEALAPVAQAAAAPAGSYQDYALSKLGGNGSQFSCLEHLWGKESGWNPNAKNPSSTAYGIPQFLDSTWGGTGIAKTSDGYRQIDAGLIYIERRYGSPCGAWSHSQATNWY